ncbi:MAG: hypothetical protein J0L92_01405 [Deltaproteobacteria bacterium]|nr:hypothetical protein [Deltaproteobacteria bacterium]
MLSSSQLAASIVFGFGALVLGACGSSWDPDHQARDQASTALDCSEVSLVKIADNRYRAEGCGGVVEVLCSAGHNEPVCLVGRARSEEHVSGIADLGSGGEDPEGEGPSGPDADDEHPIEASDTSPPSDEVAAIETTIRGGLDAHRDDVLACTSRSASVVRVRYAFDGSVTITLGGDLEGSPEEGCVRAALGGVRVSGGHEGTVMHLVRRGPSAP